ncbi:MAG: DUF1156 domain-containing protein, partial [Chloroflexi bacterium]|nr:DUF1156 domain-containing protein [Chloroflexota bacterium]
GTCLLTGAPMPFDYIRAEAKAGRMGARLMAIVAEGPNGRIYLPPTPEHEAIAAQAQPENVPDTYLPEQALGFRVQLYGMTKHRDLFTSRQLVALTTFSDLVREAREQVQGDALAVRLPKGEATAYADAVATYLAFGLSRMLSQSSTICPWSSNPAHELVVNMFSRQAIPMTWDFGEINPFCQAASWEKNLSFVPKVLEKLNIQSSLIPNVTQAEVTTSIGAGKLKEKWISISTDPPYYDNIGYADLSDFFYI